MKATDLYREITRYCRQHADEERVKKYARYFKEGYDAYGLADDLLKDKIDKVLKTRGVNIKMILDTGDSLIESGKYEEAFFAILLLKGFSEEFSAGTFERVGHWFDLGIVNWAHTDVLCRELTSVFLQEKVITVEAFVSWRLGQNKFQRRAVPVSLLELLKSTEDFQTLFEFIGPLMLDEERVVQQGLGWFLREAWKIRGKETESFLLKWKNTAPRTIYQYATEKMSKEEKQRFRREKKVK